MTPEAIAALLPSAMGSAAGDGPLRAVLEVMTVLSERAEATLDHLDAYFDPARCPERFVAYLADWVGYGWLAGPMVSTGRINRLRTVVAQAHATTARRGTAEGLCRLLDTAAGPVNGEDSFRAELHQTSPFHVVVHIPPGAAFDLARLIITHERPVFTTVELVSNRPPPPSTPSGEPPPTSPTEPPPLPSPTPNNAGNPS